MLRYDTSPIKAGIDRIINSPWKATVFDYQAILHTSKTDLRLMKLTTITVERDTTHNLGEAITLVAYVGLGEYIYDIIDNFMNLEVSLYRYPLSYGLTNDRNQRFLVERYKAILDFQVNKDLRKSDYRRLDKFDLDSRDIVKIILTLQDRSLEAVLVDELSGSFRNVTRESLLTSALTTRAKAFKSSGKQAIDAVDIFPCSNKETIEQLLIPIGVRTLDLPTYIHKHYGGLYPGGVGTFIQRYQNKKTLFVYPLYHREKIGQNDKVLMLFKLPPDRLPAVDVSFRVDGSVISAVVREESVQANDNSYAPDGFRSVDPISLTAKPATISKTGVIADPSRLLNDVVHRKREDGVYQSRVVKGGLSENPMVASESIMQGSMQRFDVIWDRSDYQLLLPGMRVIYHYLDLKGKLTKVTGVLLYTHTLIGLPPNSAGNNKFFQTTYLTFGVRPGD